MTCLKNIGISVMPLEKRGQLFLVPHFDISKRTKCNISCCFVWQNDISHPSRRFYGGSKSVIVKTMICSYCSQHVDCPTLIFSNAKGDIRSNVDITLNYLKLGTKNA